jgi:hypothetical protein
LSEDRRRRGHLVAGSAMKSEEDTLSEDQR